MTASVKESVSPLLKHPEETIIVPPRLFPGLDYYAKTVEYGKIAVDWNARYDKRDKAARRYNIADVNGPLALTVPVVKPDSFSRATWNDILISSHGDWQSVHLTALESAYGRTPYFEFYIDSLRPLFSRDWNESPLRQYIERSHSILSGLLPLPPFEALSSVKAIGTNQSLQLNDIEIKQKPYWQPRIERLGFIPGLSILDALFCLGPTLILHLLPAGLEVDGNK
ncbi:MAG: WbqC family protein [Paramuribaculum sp.]|nr:WbqC family protein [Paramuribaculum sp.]